MNSFIYQHNQFLKDVNAYINHGYLCSIDRLISFFSISTSLKKNVIRIINNYDKLKNSVPHLKLSHYSLALEPYSECNPYVLRMRNILSEYLRNDLLGAYIHGSLGSNEEILYSDFDGLIILSKEVFQNPKRLVSVAKRLYKAQKIMFEFDPLQHHGWFVLTEEDLKQYPEFFLPIQVFKHSKSLFIDKGRNLNINSYHSLEMIKSFFNELCNSLSIKIKKKIYPNNIYLLKIFLSRFMLLPSYYIHIKTGKGIYKKLSFSAAREYFSKENWAIMDEISFLRENWTYKISLEKRVLITKYGNISRYLAKKIAPPIPDKIKILLTDTFYQRVLNLIDSMKTDI